MRFLHISDLHIGKRVNEFSMLEDQRHVLEQILDYGKTRQPDCVLIAGDLYDRPIPPAEAVALADWFFTALAGMKIPVCVISGNHDSPERLAFGGKIMEKQGIYIASRPAPVMKRVELSDSFGPVHIYLLPFVRREEIKSFYPEETINSCQDGVKCVLSHTRMEEKIRRVLVAHQFVAGHHAMPAVCDSETRSIGGTEEVDPSLFDGFSYVALGHLHGPQKVGKASVRYAGSPLKYSFSEERHQKSAVLAELLGNGETRIQLLPLTPLHDMRTIRGPLEGLLDKEVAALGDCRDYIRAQVTDEAEKIDVLSRLRAVYPNLMELSLESRKYRQIQKEWGDRAPAKKGPGELFNDFFEMQNGRNMDQEEQELFEKLERKGENL